MTGNLNQARLLIEGLGVKENEESLEMSLSAIERFGNYKNALLESSSEPYKFDKAMVKLIKLSNYKDEKDEFETQAEEILTLLHVIHKTVVELAQSNNTSEEEAIRVVDIGATFKLNPKQRCVLNKIGGRETILHVTLSEPNTMIRKIVNALELCSKTINSNQMDSLPFIGSDGSLI